MDKVRKEFITDDLKEDARYKWDQAKYDPTAGNFFDLLERLKFTAKQVYQDNAAKFIQTILFETLPISIQQDIKNHNKKDGLSRKERHSYAGDESKTNSPQATTLQPFLIEPNGCLKTCRASTTWCKTADQTLRRKVLLWQQTGTLRSRMPPEGPRRNKKNSTVKPRSRKPRNQQETRNPYNWKLVCQVCSYTGDLAKYCRQRQQNATPRAQIPFDRQSSEANKNRRREIRSIMGEVRKNIR